MQRITVIFMLIALGFLQVAMAQPPDVIDVNHAQWQKIKDEDGIQVYSIAVQDTAIVKARAVAIINAPLEKIQRLVDDFSQRPQWVPYLQHSKIIKKISPAEHIEYSLFSAPWPASDRDFVYRVKRSQAGVGSSFQLSYHMQSVEHTAMPLQPGLIRGEIFSSVYRLTPTSDGQTRVELIYHADPKGWLPSWIVNIIQRGFPFRMMQKLRRQLQAPATEAQN